MGFTTRETQFEAKGNEKPAKPRSRVQVWSRSIQEFERNENRSASGEPQSTCLDGKTIRPGATIIVTKLSAGAKPILLPRR